MLEWTTEENRREEGFEGKRGKMSGSGFREKGTEMNGGDGEKKNGTEGMVWDLVNHMRG